MGRVSESPDKVRYELQLGFPGDRRWVTVRTFASFPEPEYVDAAVAHVRQRHISLGLPGPGANQQRIVRIESYVVDGPRAVNGTIGET